MPVKTPVPAKLTPDILNRVRNDAFERLSFRQRETTNLHLDERIYDKGETVGPRRQEIIAERPSILVFADDEPKANFAHACRYLLYDASSGVLHREVPAQFPPHGAERSKTLRPFHEPVRFIDNPNLYRFWPWFRCPAFIPAYQRYAILYSGMSNKRHLNDLEFLYRTLIDIYHFDPKNILAYSYDGSLNTQDGVQSKWPGDNTNYRIQINGSGTRAAFEAGIDSLKAKLKKDDLLLIHTNNHGGYDGTPGTANLCTYPNWDGYYASDFANKLGGLPNFGKLIVMMEQCHSGGFNQPIINHSTATATSVASACVETQNSYVSADGNWDPFARDWIAAQAGHDAFGGGLAFNADSNGDGKIEAQEAFDYANAIKLALDSPIFNENAPAGGDITLGKQYRIWWWWCFILRERLEPSFRRLPPEEFALRFKKIQPELAKLAGTLEEQSDAMRKDFEGKIASVLATTFDAK
jgi:hypothetical protein